MSKLPPELTLVERRKLTWLLEKLEARLSAEHTEVKTQLTLTQFARELIELDGGDESESEGAR